MIFWEWSHCGQRGIPKAVVPTNASRGEFETKVGEVACIRHRLGIPGDDLSYEEFQALDFSHDCGNCQRSHPSP